MKDCTTCGRSLPATAEFFPPRKVGGAVLRGRCRACTYAANTSRYARLYAHPIKSSYSDDGALKRCSGCGKDKPATSEFFSPEKKFEGGLRSRCRDCVNARRRSLERRETSRLSVAKWRSENPENARRLVRAYRARKMAATGTHTTEDVLKQLEGQKGRCYWCQKPLDKYHVDHLFALARGGSNGPENIVCACQSCNNRKHAKTPWDFAGRLM